MPEGDLPSLVLLAATCLIALAALLGLVLRRPNLPLLVAAGVLIASSAATIAYRLVRPYPINPWESALIADAWRTTRGLPVYTMPEDDHAATIYGPATHLTLAATFLATGANVYAGRVVNLLCGLALTTLLALVCTHGKPRVYTLVAWALLFATNLVVGNYFVETRPDVAALFFSALSAVLFYRGHAARSWRTYALGILCLLVGFLFKQTSAMFAVLPGLAVLFDRARSIRRELAWIAAPVLAVSVVVLAIRLAHPVAFHYLFEIVGACEMRLRLIVPSTFDILRQNLLFFPFVFAWILTARASERDKPREAWILAALLLTIPASVLATIKKGGDVNSHMPALIAIAVFCIERFDWILGFVQQNAAPLGKRVLCSGCFAWVLVLSFFDRPSSIWHWAVVVQNGDSAYPRVIEAASRLPGLVICPEDPTIPIHAKEYAGRCLYVEWDAFRCTSRLEMPDYIKSYVKRADWVIVPPGTWGERLSDAGLREFGFEPAQFIGLEDLQRGEYALWGRKGIEAPRR